MKNYKTLLALAVAALLIVQANAAEPDVKEALQAASQCRFGQTREPLTDAANLIQKMAQTPSGRKQAAALLLESFQGEGTLEFKDFVSRQLARFGGEEQASALGNLLSNGELAEMARYALERIPGPAADKALLDALGKTAGKTRIGIVNSLGERKTAQAVSALSPLLGDGDPQMAAAAARALGRIGGVEAARALREALPKAAPDRATPIASACLACADRLLRENKKDEAAATYEFVYESQEPQGGSKALQGAAFAGLISARGEKALPQLLAALQNADGEEFEAALALAREMPGGAVTPALVGALPNLPAERQALLLEALGVRGDAAAAPAAMAAAKGGNPEVRIAALRALGQIGDATAVPLLAQADVSSDSIERAAARESLACLRGPGVNAQIVSSMQKADLEPKRALIGALGQRNAADQVLALIEQARADQPEVRMDALKALAQIDVKELPELVQLVLDAKDDREREAAEKTIASACRRIRAKDQRAAAVLAALPRAKGPGKASLLNALAQAGGKGALEAARAALKDADPAAQEAAVRALANWDGPDSMPSLLEIAKSSREANLRVLALRGYIRLLNEMPVEPDTAALLERYKEVMPLAPSAEEKKAALAGLSRFSDPETLDFVVSFLADKEVSEEAAASIVEIGRHINSTYSVPLKAAMQKVAGATRDAGLKKKAEIIGKALDTQQGVFRGISSAPAPASAAPGPAQAPGEVLPQTPSRGR